VSWRVALASEVCQCSTAKTSSIHRIAFVPMPWSAILIITRLHWQASLASATLLNHEIDFGVSTPTG
jgi:hypothetical protein